MRLYHSFTETDAKGNVRENGHVKSAKETKVGPSSRDRLPERGIFFMGTEQLDRTVDGFPTKRDAIKWTIFVAIVASGAGFGVLNFQHQFSSEQ
jgi:hypothetical protein